MEYPVMHRRWWVQALLLGWSFCLPLLCAQKEESPSFQALADSAAASREGGNAAAAIRDYQQALVLRADWEEGWWYLGTLQYDADHLKEAIPAFQKVVELNPAQSQAWNFLGLCEFGAGDYANALQHLQKGRDLGIGDDPELSRVADYHLGLLLNRNGEFAQASAILAHSFSEQGSLQIKVALGLALLHVPLLPQEVDPSQDALVAAAGETAVIVAQGDSQKSQSSLNALLHEYPDVPYLHYTAGVVLASAGKSAEALARLREELRVFPQNSLAEIEIKRLESTSKAPLGVMQPEKPFRDPRMIERYGHRAAGPADTVAGSQPSGEAWNRAMQAYEEKRYSEAIPVLKALVQGQPDFGSAWAVLGLCEFELKDYKNSLLHLEHGQELGLRGSPESVRLARYRLATLLTRNGEFEKSRGLLAAETGKGPFGKIGAREIQFELGMTLLRIPLLPEDVDSARRELVRSTGEIAELLLDSKYDAALPMFQALLKQYPDVPFVHYAYGTALASLSQYDDAKREFRREGEISPASELPDVRLAAIALRMGQPAEELPSAKRAVELAPNSAEAHYLLGRTYLELGQTDAALKELETAAKISPGSPEVHFNLAKAYAKSKRPDKEVEERALFDRLNALAEQQRGAQGDQAYEGPRDPNSLQDSPR
jgi:tetratricopeptide (TPR) repeat protein